MLLGHWYLILVAFFLFLTPLHVRYTWSKNRSPFLGILSAFLTSIAFPICTLLIGFLSIYRATAQFCLRANHGPSYRGLVSGPDSFWASDTDKAKSIINVLVMIRFHKGRDPLTELRSVATDRLLEAGEERLRCQPVLSNWGYYYWSQMPIKIEERVRQLEGQVWDENGLKAAVSAVANDEIVGATWEILVAGQDTGPDRGVLIRIHHCLGDGFGLVQEFLRVFSTPVKMEKVTGPRRSFSYRDWAFCYAHIGAALLITLTSTPDSNSLHRPLTGAKINNWAFLDLDQVKNAKLMTGSSFTQLILTAVAKSLQNYFTGLKEPVCGVSGILPITLNPRNELKNRFTVFVLDIPLDNPIQLMTNMRQVETLPDILINYWALSVFSALCPAFVVRRAFASSIATLSYSNVPGPKSKLNLNDAGEVTSLTFWQPSRDSTGVVISSISYNNCLSIGLSVDEGLCTAEQAESIIHGIKTALHTLESHNI